MLSEIGVQFSFKGVGSGIVRGSGRQTVGVVINFISYCCCGLPLGIALMFLVFDDVTGTRNESSLVASCISAVNSLLDRHPELVTDVHQSFSVSSLSLTE